MVQVDKIEEQGAYVRLLEYDNIEGMILSSELSRRRIRSVARILRVGRNEPVSVIRVDEEKGYIDLSKRRVTPEDAAKCEDRFNKAKLVHQTMKSVAEAEGKDLEGLYRTFGWPLYQQYKHAYHAFRLMAKEADTERIWAELKKDAPEDLAKEYLTDGVRASLERYIARRLQPQPEKIRSDVDLTCFEYDGVEHIKGAMRAAMSKSTLGAPVKMVYIAAPTYCITTEAIDKDEGMAVIQAAIAAAQEHIEKRKGKLVVRMEARVLSDLEERRLKEQLEEEEQEGSDEEGEESYQEDMGDISLDDMKAITED